MPFMSITKQFKAIPISHRQPRHEGHCKYLHGHDWKFEVEISAKSVDEQTGFIFDFGDFKDFRRDVWDAMDHATLVTPDDQMLRDFDAQGWIKGFYVPDSSCEGLATFLFELMDEYLKQKTNGRAYPLRLTLWEGESNAASIYRQAKDNVA